MTHFTPVSRERHAAKGWRPVTNYSFAGDSALVPVVRTELARAAPGMPIAFIQQSGRYVLAAVLSLEPGCNQFVAADGRWLGAYIPAFLRSHPFRLVRNQDSPSDRVLCIDESASVVELGSENARPFFDEGGNLAPPTNAVLDFLGKFERDLVATDMATKALTEADVIRP